MPNEEEESSTPTDQETRFSSLEAKLVASWTCNLNTRLNTHSNQPGGVAIAVKMRTATHITRAMSGLISMHVKADTC